MKHNNLESSEKFLIRLIERKGADQGHSKRIRLFLWFLKQLSRIYRSIIQLRLWCYNKGILRHHTLGCQVISVGNLTVGGTGKTPVVEIFARELQAAGRRVAILSRGYKKAQPPFLQRLSQKLTLHEQRTPPRIVSDGNALLLDSAMSGDEPYMLASNLPNVAVLVDKDRVKSGRYAINKLGCDTLILDDGFQYLSLKPRVQIVLVDKTNPFGNENVLPRGILREPIKNIKRADFIFITKSDGNGTEELKAQLRRLNTKAEIIECRHCPRYLQHVTSRDRKELGYLAGKRVTALSGIAAPAGFESSLESFGASIIQHCRFADHHRYSQQELIDIINNARREKADAIITTEKDAVRFPSLGRYDVPIYFLRVDIDILQGEADFRASIARICFRDIEKSPAS
ncbi:MAG TPA: tetraacyldisaccharide 4'-kinase [Verrucomicrobia bacterium]|nr:tetraacyldisaccharide 4'-kinase [Verrucomicrobiota bacterium]